MEKISFVYILLVTIVCQQMPTRGNGMNENNSQVVDSIKCGSMNISCGFGKVCKGGVCIDVETNSTELGPTEMTYKVVTDPTYGVIADYIPTTYYNPDRTHRGTTTKRHGFMSGNQEFIIAIVGFCVLFFNFCLISFCLGRMKRRRLERQRRQQATHSTQASQTGDWNAEHVNLGIDNFALNGELDGFSSDFVFSQVRLPPYDFSSAYHKPRPMTAEGESTEGESSGDVIVDVDDTENINEDPPPYSDQQVDHFSSPPSYDEALLVSTCVGESTF